MTRADMLARLDSRELTGWMVLHQVQQEEAAIAATRQRDVADSGDGVVIEYGRPRGADPDDEDEDDDG